MKNKEIKDLPIPEQDLQIAMEYRWVGGKKTGAFSSTMVFITWRVVWENTKDTCSALSYANLFMGSLYRTSPILNPISQASIYPMALYEPWPPPQFPSSYLSFVFFLSNLILIILKLCSTSCKNIFPWVFLFF